MIMGIKNAFPSRYINTKRMKSIKPLLFKTLKSRIPPLNYFVPIQMCPLTFPVMCKVNYYPCIQSGQRTPDII